MENNENRQEVISVEKVTYAADINSPIAAKVKRLEEEAEKKKELELRRSEMIRVQQDYLNGMLDNVTETLAATEKERQINDALEADVRKQVLSMHGISGDKYDGMERRNQAVFQGAEFALFFMSVILVIISGILNGMFVDITLFLCFFTAIEGTLLNHGERPRVIQCILRVLYLILFPVMLAAFVYYVIVVSLEKVHVSSFTTFYAVASIIGVVILMLGVISYFLYDPYRQDKKQLRKAGKYLRNMGKAANKEVSRNIKAFEKQQRKEEKKQAKADREEAKKQEKNEPQTEQTEETQNTADNTDETAENTTDK
ncbi:MAG: hypothetical protein IJ641_07425 [Lachnospiraceae bacterium]|nr:hypothetical protein [Lachnospiraceae bacterium]